MTATLWAPLISGFAGVAGALGGVWLTQRATRRREEDNYQRAQQDRRDERLQALYLDMAQHLEATHDWVFRMMGDTSGRDTTLEYPIKTTMVSARLDLYGSTDLFNAWMGYVSFIDQFFAAIRNAGDQPFHEWAGDEPPIAYLLESIEKVRGDLRAAAQ